MPAGVTTLYFEADKEDDLRRVGYSKERRVDPQIIVGLLVDRGGFPLRIGCWEGDRAETTTIVPVVREFVRSAGSSTWWSWRTPACCRPPIWRPWMRRAWASSWVRA